MTIEAQPKPIGPYDTGTGVELETAPIEALGADQTVNSFALLDHRTRGRAVARRFASRGPHLSFDDGEDTWLIPLEDNVTHIGRSLSSEVRIEDSRVSRSHAIIVRHGRYARVLDNRSSNGTHLNRRRVVATNLTDGDLIAVGPVVMRYIEIR
jgi:hypothetical protein